MTIIMPEHLPPAPPEDDRASEALEIMAIAIAERMSKRRGGHTLAAWHVSPERREALDYARAGLAAMRKPTQEMLNAGANAVSADAWCATGGTGVEGAGDVWEAMLDELLK